MPESESFTVERVVVTDFSWRHAGRKTPAVSGVNFTIEAGERVLLLGASGAGKSTLLTAMAGLLPTDSGEQTGTVHVDGTDARHAREKVGILFQDPQSQLVMAKSGDDVAFGLENRGAPPATLWPSVRDALSLVGFEYGLDRLTHELSGGEQQRLALAGVVAQRPDLLLLDEPTANLDPASGRMVRKALARVLAESPDTAMVLVEHRVTEVLPLVDRVIVLAAGGGILADGKPDDVFDGHGDRLAQLGVWVPASAPATPRRGPGAGRALLRGRDLRARFPGAETAAVTDVTITVHDHELLAITGASGSGKSTLARLMGGLVAPDVGSVVATEHLSSASAPLHRWRAARLAASIGSVFQNPEQQFVTTRVKDELDLRPRRLRHHPDQVSARTTELLERLRLNHLADANPFTLSGGEARRLSVATALATTPKVLIFDEPTFGQDLRTWSELADLIAALRDEGSGIIVVSHDTEFVTATADRTLTMAGGALCSI